MAAVFHDFTTGTHQACCTMGNRSFPGVKKPGHGVNYPPPSSPEFKKKKESYTSTPCPCLHGRLWGELYFTFYTFSSTLVCDFITTTVVTLFMCLLGPENTFEVTNNNKANILIHNYSPTIINSLCSPYSLVLAFQSITVFSPI